MAIIWPKVNFPPLMRSIRTTDTLDLLVPCSEHQHVTSCKRLANCEINSTRDESLRSSPNRQSKSSSLSKLNRPRRWFCRSPTSSTTKKFGWTYVCHSQTPLTSPEDQNISSKFRNALRSPRGWSSSRRKTRKNTLEGCCISRSCLRGLQSLTVCGT